MPVTIRCPSCGTASPAPQDLLGRKVRCKQCSGMFVAGSDRLEEAELEELPAPGPAKRTPPRHEDEPEARPRARRRPVRAANRNGVWIAAGIVVALLGLGGILALVLARDSDDAPAVLQVRPSEPAKADRPTSSASTPVAKPNAPPDPGTVVIRPGPPLPPLDPSVEVTLGSARISGNTLAFEFQRNPETSKWVPPYIVVIQPESGQKILLEGRKEGPGGLGPPTGFARMSGTMSFSLTTGGWTGPGPGPGGPFGPGRAKPVTIDAGKNAKIYLAKAGARQGGAFGSASEGDRLSNVVPLEGP